MKQLYFYSFFLLFIFFPLPAQEIFRNTVPGADVLSLQISKDNQLINNNLLLLEKDPEELIISFDLTGHGRRTLSYRVTHCNAVWEDSGLDLFEYMAGFPGLLITDYRFSQNTIPLYTHYRIQIPNEELQPLIPGNYVLTVFDENEPDTPLLSACFYVAEPVLQATGTIIPHNDRTYQQLQLEIFPFRNSGNLYPAEHLKIFVKQNNRPDNYVQLPTSSSVNGNRIIYTNHPALLFEAGNQYRTLEFLSTSRTGKNITKQEFRSPDIHLYLAPDTPHTPRQYQKDWNDKYQIGCTGCDSPQISANYYQVHFYFNSPYLPEGEIHLNGEFLHNEISGKSRLDYNQQKQHYEKTIFLKGGSYNYQYLFVSQGKTIGSTAPTEGNYFETTNEYTVLIYYSPPGVRYDRLIGYSVISNK